MIPKLFDIPYSTVYDCNFLHPCDKIIIFDLNILQNVSPKTVTPSATTFGQKEKVASTTQKLFSSNIETTVFFNTIFDSSLL